MFTDKIRKLDIYWHVPESLKEASYMGLAFTFLFFLLSAVLIFNTLIGFTKQQIDTELTIDHMKDDQNIQVYIDITLYKYPCGLVSLDVMDVLHSHTLNVKDELKKIRINQHQKVIQEFEFEPTMDFNTRLQIIQQQLQNQEGCRLKGFFDIKSVPGNFHISMHDQVPEFQYLLYQERYLPDFSHKINILEFGQRDQEKVKKIWKDFKQDSHEQNIHDSKDSLQMEGRGPLQVMYKLNIIPSWFIYGEDHSFELYQYNHEYRAVLSNAMMIIFDFNIENFIMTYKKQGRNIVHNLIQLVSIIGGSYAIFMVIKSFLEDGLMNLAFKKRIGKLD